MSSRVLSHRSGSGSDPKRNLLAKVSAEISDGASQKQGSIWLETERRRVDAFFANVNLSASISTTTDLKQLKVGQTVKMSYKLCFSVRGQSVKDLNEVPRSVATPPEPSTHVYEGSHRPIKVSFKVLKTSVEAGAGSGAVTPFVLLCIPTTTNSSGQSITIEPFISDPFFTVRYIFNVLTYSMWDETERKVSKRPGLGPYDDWCLYYNQKGGKKNLLEAHACLQDRNGKFFQANSVSDFKLSICTSFTYEKSPSEPLKSSLLTFEDSEKHIIDSQCRVLIKYKIEHVSSQHQDQKFVLHIGPNSDVRGLSYFEIGWGKTAPVLVKARPSNKNKGKRKQVEDMDLMAANPHPNAHPKRPSVGPPGGFSLGPGASLPPSSAPRGRGGRGQGQGSGLAQAATATMKWVRDVVTAMSTELRWEQIGTSPDQTPLFKFNNPNPCLSALLQSYHEGGVESSLRTICEQAGLDPFPQPEPQPEPPILTREVSDGRWQEVADLLGSRQSSLVFSMQPTEYPNPFRQLSMEPLPLTASSTIDSIGTMSSTELNRMPSYPIELARGVSDAFPGSIFRFMSDSFTNSSNNNNVNVFDHSTAAEYDVQAILAISIAGGGCDRHPAYDSAGKFVGFVLFGVVKEIGDKGESSFVDKHDCSLSDSEIDFLNNYRKKAPKKTVFSWNSTGTDAYNNFGKMMDGVFAAFNGTDRTISVVALP